MKKLHIARIGYIVISVAFCLAAVLCLFSKSFSPQVLSICCGVFLLIYGAIKITGYFSPDLYCLAFRYDLAFGILLLVVGVIVLFEFAAAGPWLPMGAGWLALLDSVTKMQMSQEAQKFGLEQWSVILTTAIISGALSVALIFLSTIRGNSTSIPAALVLLSIGIMNLCVVKFTVPKRGASSEYKQI